jgi:hypothetical protein
MSDYFLIIKTLFANKTLAGKAIQYNTTLQNIYTKFLSYNLMLHSGKKFRTVRNKKKILTLNETKNHTPHCKLNGRSLSELLLFNAKFGGYAMTRTYIRRNVNEVRLVLDLHAYLNFYSSSSLEQTSAGKHVGRQIWR